MTVFALRSRRITMERLATVSGWVFSPASIFGQKVWKSLKLMSALLPTRQLVLPPLRCPVLSTPSGCCRGGHHHDDHQPTWIRLKGSVTRAAKKPFLLRVSLRPPLETPPPPSEREEATLPKGPELRICGRRELGRARVIVTPVHPGKERRLMCSVGGKPTEVKVRNLVAWIEGERETESLVY